LSTTDTNSFPSLHERVEKSGELPSGEKGEEESCMPGREVSPAVGKISKKDRREGGGKIFEVNFLEGCHSYTTNHYSEERKGYVWKGEGLS